MKARQHVYSFYTQKSGLTPLIVFYQPFSNNNIWHHNCLKQLKIFMGDIMEHDKKGMTLIELLVTLAIFSIMLSLILGISTSQVGRAGLKGSANEIIGEINSTRGLAAKENRPIALTFTSETYKKHFYENGVWSPGFSDSFQPDGKVSLGTRIDAYSIIVFNSQGMLIDPNTFLLKGNITITLTSEQSEGIKIKVYSYGGIKSKNSWRHRNEYSSF